jgi:two-component system chemotaxis sensor kinase CheA
MLPFSQACESLYRAVRDLARTQQKEVELLIEGNEVELDRAIIDALRDPLLHLVRNAIDHGIETPQQRIAAGKRAGAKLTVAASQRMELVEVTVRDDGRGIDPALVQSAARRRGLPAELQNLDPLRLIFEPGFSTASSVSEVSGRGVGLDVVKSQLEALRGTVEVSSELGRGTSFNLLVPLTVSTLRVLFVRVGSEVYALPSTSVRQLVRAGPDKIRMIDNREVLLLGAAPIPIVSLAELVGAPAGPPPMGEGKVPLVVTAHMNQVIALAVDELLSEQDVVCKPLGKRIARLTHVSAATILPTGRVALLLKHSDLLRVGISRAPARRNVASADTAASARKRLLLVDDSATIRTLECSILEAAGHEVIVAVDGSNAWQLLQEKGADLVVSDVEMPNMDGFALTQAIRSSKRFRDLPVILLTSLDSAADRARGLESGASAYLVKSAFDQSNLLETIRQLL